MAFQDVAGKLRWTGASTTVTGFTHWQARRTHRRKRYNERQLGTVQKLSPLSTDSIYVITPPHLHNILPQRPQPINLLATSKNICPSPLLWPLTYSTDCVYSVNESKLEMWANVMAALPNIGGALCSTPQSLADAQYLTAVQ